MEIMEFESPEAAIRRGRQSGCAYMIEDLSTGKTYDCEEIDMREEEDWFYDETEMIWKRKPGGSVLKRMLSIAMPFNECFPGSSVGFTVCAG